MISLLSLPMFLFHSVTDLVTFLTPDFFQLFYVGFILFCLYTATWMLSVKLRDATLVNFLWGLSLSLQAIMYFYKSLDHSIFSFFTEKFSWEKSTFYMLIFAHGLRLSSYLILREIGHHEEDQRYVKLRERYGKHFWWLSYFTVFMPAMVLNFLMGSVIYAFANTDKGRIGHLTYWFGIFTMLGGGLLGTLADMQRYNFNSNKRNEGKICDQGLWSLSRHPNYLGEVLYWWGVYAVNFSAGIVWTSFAPILMSFMIIFVSGIPVNEAMLKEEHEKEYVEYANRVPIFLPFLPAGVPKGLTKGEGDEEVRDGDKNSKDSRDSKDIKKNRDSEKKEHVHNSCIGNWGQRECRESKESIDRPKVN